MKQAEKNVIEVLLTEINDEDVLVFYLDSENSEKYVVNLNNSSSQIQIKEVFSKLIEILLEKDVELALKIPEEYSKGLYKDVCKEYILDLNREIKQVKSSIENILR